MPNCSDCGHYVRAEERSCSYCVESKRPRTAQDIKRIYRTCAFCNGVGKVEGPFGMATPITHKLCAGTGYNLIPEDWQPCDHCCGTGKETYGGGITTMEKPCRHCKGAGWAPKTC
jgi:DnaJ-class molecular chaperone